MSEQKIISKQNNTSISRRSFLKLSGTVGALAALSEFAFNGPVKTLVAGATSAAVKEDKWVKSECRVCSTVDCINVHVVDGMINKIEGYPDGKRTEGKLCARGSAGFWFVYDPYRVKTPLKRTNPQKGVGVDPKWVEISWDEAYNTIAEQAKKVRAKGEEGNMWYNEYSRLSYSQGELYTAFKQAMAGDCYSVEMGMNWCGHTAHYTQRVAHGSFSHIPYFLHNKYNLMFGRDHAFVWDSTQNAEFIANSRENGAKVVHLSPVMSHGANVLDEWIPILPTTDGAFASAMLNVLIHELGTYDVDFIKKWTNGPYLIRSDNGYYARDPETNKPLMWDPVDNKAKTFDDKTFKDYAIEGTFTVGDVNATPAWQLLKDAVKSMTPEWAAPITTVPASTIRRIAKEFGEAAQVGSTIMIHGKERAYRPVAVPYAGNSSNHVHGFANGWSILLLNTIMGAWDVPGSMGQGASGVRTWVSSTADIRWKNTKDGLIPHPDASYDIIRSPGYHFEFPPKTAELEELFPFGDHFGALSVLTMSNPDEYWGVGKAHQVEFGYGHCYGLLSMYAVKKITDLLATIPFLATSNIFLEEVTDFADIVLPDRCYLEEFQVKSGWLQQPVVEPLNPIPHIYDVWIEIADRTGCLYGKGGFNDQVNIAGRYKDQYKLDLNKKYTTEQIFDQICKNTNGKGLDWWKENGGDPDTTPYRESDPGYDWYKDRRLRLPIYVELHKRVADELKTKLESNGVKWDYEDYATLPKWIPSHITTETPPYDLIEVAYMHNLGGFLSTNANPWIAEITEKFDPYGLYVWMNEETAKARGIVDGDLIWVESEQDKRQAHAKLSQTVHPKIVAVHRHFGRYAGNSVIKDLSDRHLGISHQTLRPLKMEYIDKVNDSLENCIKVRVYKA